MLARGTRYKADMCDVSAGLDSLLALLMNILWLSVNVSCFLRVFHYTANS